MRTAFITRSTLYTVPGGDTVQVLQTARFLRKRGISTDILLTSDAIDYTAYDLFHFTNLTRPADMLYHIRKSKKPFVVSPVLVDYSEYDRVHRDGMAGKLLRLLPRSANEYMKTVARWITGRDSLKSKSYLWKGQRKSIREILAGTAMLLPNSGAEYRRIREEYGTVKEYAIVPNGIDPGLFKPGDPSARNEKLVLCAARIEGIKNQLNLIKALNNTRYTLVLAGSPAPNQREYYHHCRRVAAGNIVFQDHLPQEKLAGLYRQAAVHALPSWFETCGLSTLEAAATGCRVVVTDKGYTRDYFGEDAVYCDPGDPASIFEAIDKAARSDMQNTLQQRVISQYTWAQAAAITAGAYQKAISS